MNPLLTFARRQVGATCILAFAILAACTSSSPSGDDPDAGNGGFPQCTATQRCVGYPSFGDWVCLESCSGTGGGDCPSDTTCETLSGCCTGTACSAVSAHVCVASDAGAGGDGASDARSDGNGVGRPRVQVPEHVGMPGDADGGFPQCTGTQRCVGDPFGHWVCLASCSGVGATDCRSGTTCTSASGCCTGTSCSAASEYVCVAP